MMSDFVGGDAPSVQGVAPAADPLLLRRHAVVAAEIGDAPMAEPQEMLHRVARALAIVRADIGQGAADHPSHGDDGRNGLRPLLRERPRVGAARRAHDDPRDVMLAQRAQHLRLPLRILVGVGEDRREAELVERVLDADRQFGEERVGEVADDHADEIGRRGAQARGAAMIDIAERPHRPRDALARRLGDQLRCPTSTSETVDLETPARRATSTIVTRPDRSPDSSLSLVSGIASAVSLERSIY